MSVAPFSKLQNLMEGVNTLKGWDVLVSYNEDQLNALLATRAEQIKEEVKMEDFFVKIKIPRFGEVTYNVSLNYGIPTMKFLDGAGEISLAFPMSGTLAGEDKSDPSPLPKGLKVTFITNLVNVQGTTAKNENDETMFITGGNPEPKPRGYVVALDPGADTAQAICITLEKQKVILNFSSDQPEIDPEDMSFYEGLLSAAIKEHFSSAAGLKYYLACIDNSYEKISAQSTILKPTRFCFDVLPGDASRGIPGSLCTWIGVLGGAGNGQVPSSELRLTFNPRGDTYNPIPEKNTASIIFSHDLLANLFFVPGLQSAGCTDVVPTSRAGSPGMAFSLNLPKQAFKADGIFYNGLEWDGYHIELMSAVYFDLSSPRLENPVTQATQVKIDPGLALVNKPPVHVTYESARQDLPWSNTIALPPFPLRGANGTVYMTFRFDGEAQWEGDTETDINQLRLRWKLPNKFAIEVKSEDKAWWQKLFGGSEEIPSRYTDLSFDIPPINIDFDPLEYFLTTNLLFPGAHLFLADPPVSTGNLDHGLATPRDTILTGQIATEIKPNIFVTSLPQAMVDAGHPTFRIRHRHKKAQSTGLAVPQKTAKQFREDLLASPGRPLLGDLLVAIATGGDQLDSKVYSVLQRYGYDQLTDVDYCNLLRTTPEAVLARAAALSDDSKVTTNGVKHMVNGNSTPQLNGHQSINDKHHNTIKQQRHHKHHKPPATLATHSEISARFVDFDIRVFAAIYSITAPQADATAGTKLIVNAQTGLINYDQVNSTYTTSVDEGITTVLWATSVNNYQVVFASSVDPTTGATTLSFSGTETPVSGGSAVPFSGTQYTPPAPPNPIPFSLRDFGALYDITAPPTDHSAGKQLVVNPNTGFITYDGVESVPSTLTDASGVTQVLWSISGSQYAVIFTSLLTSDNNFLASFNGTVTTMGSSQPFSGTQHVLTNTDNFPIADPVSVSISTILNYGFGLLGFVGFGLSLYWHRVGNRERPAQQQQLVDAMAARTATTMQFGLTELQAQIKHTADGLATRVDGQTNWESYGPELDVVTKEAVRERIERLTLQELEVLADQDPIEYIERANQAVGEGMEGFGRESGFASIADVLQPWYDAKLLTEAQVRDYCNNALEPRIQERTRIIVEPQGVNGSSFVRERVVSLILQESMVKRDALIAQINVRIGALGIEYDTASGEADRIEGEQTRLREEANRANDPVVKERLEREANNLQTEIDRQREEAERAQREGRDAEGERTRNEDRNEREGREKENLDREAEIRKREALRRI